MSTNETLLRITKIVVTGWIITTYIKRGNNS
jgi:hypothetical protein